jgi:hypothetical protein
MHSFNTPAPKLPKHFPPHAKKLALSRAGQWRLQPIVHTVRSSYLHQRNAQDNIASFGTPAIVLLVLVGGLLTGTWIANLVPTLAPLDGPVADALRLKSKQAARPRSGYQTPPGLSNRCNSNTSPAFDPAFDELHARLGDGIGGPVECAHVNSENGDLLQRTSRGLAVRRASGGFAIFTDGHQHWAIVDGTMVNWSGPSVDPPVRGVDRAKDEAEITNTEGTGVVLRASPQLDARTPRGLIDGTRVTILEREGREWARVRDEHDQEGWIPTQYLGL